MFTVVSSFTKRFTHLLQNRKLEDIIIIANLTLIILCGASHEKEAQNVAVFVKRSDQIV